VVADATCRFYLLPRAHTHLDGHTAAGRQLARKSPCERCGQSWSAHYPPVYTGKVFALPRKATRPEEEGQNVQKRD
jgi:hypothetical protein